MAPSSNQNLHSAEDEEDEEKEPSFSSTSNTDAKVQVSTSGVKSVVEMASQLQELLALQLKDLQERQATLHKQRQLFEQQYPQLGKESDVLHLNVGGSVTIAVLRRTLTHFENSMLASRFSGRWDDSLEKDQDGRFFIDQDPQVFVPLLNYLRQCDQRTRDDITVKPPRPTAEFCSMLEYYGLMNSLYPQEWLKEHCSNKGVVVTRESTTYGVHNFTISNSSVLKTFMLQVQRDCPTKPVNANSFTVVFEQGSRGFIGWMTNSEDSDDATDESDDEYSDDDDDPEQYDEDCFYFDIMESKFRVKKNANKTKKDGGEWTRKLPVTIVCTRNASTTNTYSIQVLEDESDAKIMDTYCTKKEMFPFITLRGKVTISNVLYDF